MKAIEYLLTDGKFSVQYNSPRRDFTDLRSELMNDAVQISKTYGPVFVAFSSGADSQIIARCFESQHLPARYVFLHVIGCNDLELQRIKKCEERLGIKVEIFSLDLKSKEIEWTERAKTEQYHAMHQYQFEWLSEQLDEDWPIVTQGSVEPAVVGTNMNDVGIYHNYYEEMECRFRLMGAHRKVLDFPNSPEAVAAYYTDSAFTAFCASFQYYATAPGVDKTQHFNTFAKAIVKGKHFPDVLWFPKLSGFENHPSWIKTEYNFATKVSVPYWSLYDFMNNQRNSTRTYSDWHYTYGNCE